MTLSKPLQYQALAKRLSENGTALSSVFANLTPADFTGICRLCWQELDLCDQSPPEPGSFSRLERIYAVTVDHPEREEFIEQLRQVTAGAGWPVLQSLEKLYGRLGQVAWLWPGWLPRGYLTLLGAAAGLGKSLVALDLAGRLLDRRPWPDGSPPADAAAPAVAAASAIAPAIEKVSARADTKVIYIDAEAVPQLLLQRARLWHLDTDRIFPFVPLDDQPIDLSQESQRQQLSEYCSLVQPELVILDALSSACWSVLNNPSGLHQILAFLQDLASERQIGILLIHHLRKQGRQFKHPPPLTLDDLFGSFYITAMSRLVLGLRPFVNSSVSISGGLSPRLSQGFNPRLSPGHPDVQIRLLEVLKTNLGPPPPPLLLQIHRSPADPGTVPLTAPVPVLVPALTLQWEPALADAISPSGTPSAFTDGHSSDPGSPYTPLIAQLEPEPAGRQACMAWLLNLLAEHESGLRVSDILLRARQAGFSRRTLFRSRHDLQGQLINTHGRSHPLNCWKLRNRNISSPE